MEERHQQPTTPLTPGLMELYAAMRHLEAQVMALRTDLTEMKAQSAYTNKTMQALEELVRQNKVLMYGDDNDPGNGLLIRMDRLERAMSVAKWVAVAILLPVIGLIVSALFELIQQVK